MLPYPERFRLKRATLRGSRLMFAWFVFLLLVAFLSVGMLVTAIVQAADTDMSQDIGPRDAKGTDSSKPTLRYAVYGDGGVKCRPSFLQPCAIQPARW